MLSDVIEELRHVLGRCETFVLFTLNQCCSLAQPVLLWFVAAHRLGYSWFFALPTYTYGGIVLATTSKFRACQKMLQPASTFVVKDSSAGDDPSDYITEVPMPSHLTSLPRGSSIIQNYRS